MKAKLLVLTFALFLCVALSSLILYRTHNKRTSKVDESHNYKLAATDIALSGLTQKGDSYKVKLDNVKQISLNLYEINMAVVEHTNHITNITQKFDIKCKNVTVHYRPDSEHLDKLEFRGGVTITSVDRIAYGDVAEFISGENIVVLYGNAALKEKQGYLKGEKIIYRVKDDTFKVIGGTKVIINER